MTPLHCNYPQCLISRGSLFPSHQGTNPPTNFKVARTNRLWYYVQNPIGKPAGPLQHTTRLMKRNRDISLKLYEKKCFNLSHAPTLLQWSSLRQRRPFPIRLNLYHTTTNLELHYQPPRLADLFTISALEVSHNPKRALLKILLTRFEKNNSLWLPRWISVSANNAHITVNFIAITCLLTLFSFPVLGCDENPQSSYTYECTQKKKLIVITKLRLMPQQI